MLLTRSTKVLLFLLEYAGGLPPNLFTALPCISQRLEFKIIVLFLCILPANVDCVNQAGDTPLHLSVWFSNVDSVAHLLNYSASIISNSLGYDPHANVMFRSPLIAKKKKFPADLRRCLAMVLEKISSVNSPSTADEHFHDCIEDADVS